MRPLPSLEEHDFDECFAAQPAMPSPSVDLARARRYRRRSRRTWAVLSAVALLAVGVAGVGWALRGFDLEAAPIAPPSYDPGSRAQLIEGIRTDPDHQGLVVNYVGGACDGPAHLAVTETSTWVEAKVVVKRTSGACSGVGISRTVSARLAEPIGERTIWAEGRRRVPFDGARLLVPTSLPAGFGGVSESGSSPEPGSGATTVVTSSWQILRFDSGAATTGETCASTRGSLTVRTGPASTDRPNGGTKVGSVKVGTAKATLYRTDIRRKVDSWAYVWRVDDRSVEVANRKGCDTDRLLSPTELLRVAESLRPA